MFKSYYCFSLGVSFFKIPDCLSSLTQGVSSVYDGYLLCEQNGLAPSEWLMNPEMVKFRVVLTE
jgi:hypothetical protein